MAEGGRFPWKMQKVWSRGPTNDYSNLREPLPNPPEGMVWKQDTNKEWKLVKEEPDLTEEDVILGIPQTSDHRSSSSSNREDEWELLSDRVSNGSGGGVMLVKASGSVRSILSLEHHETGSHTTPLSVPFKIQRTASNSTIDSSDNALGPSGKGILGVDYVEHVVLPTDTLQGICLAYKISSTRLRQANHFSGHSLFLAPKRLVIPISKKALRSGFIRVQDTDAKEYKLHAFLAEFPKLSMTEAKAYVHLLACACACTRLYLGLLNLSFLSNAQLVDTSNWPIGPWETPLPRPGKTKNGKRKWNVPAHSSQERFGLPKSEACLLARKGLAFSRRVPRILLRLLQKKRRRKKKRQRNQKRRSLPSRRKLCRRLQPRRSRPKMSTG